MPGFSTNGTDGLLPTGLALSESFFTLIGCAMVCCDNEIVSIVVVVSRTRLIAWTKAAHVGAKKEKELISIQEKETKEY